MELHKQNTAFRPRLTQHGKGSSLYRMFRTTQFATLDR